jgi:hypothetical protein
MGKGYTKAEFREPAFPVATTCPSPVYRRCKERSILWNYHRRCCRIRRRCQSGSNGEDLPHLAFFLGLRVNELVMDRTLKAGFSGVRESHGYVIQHLIESPRTITELSRRLEVAQQAASKMGAELIHLGLVEAIP